MTKAEIVQALYTRVGGFSKKESADLVDLVFETMKETLGRGEKIKISGFGNFVLRDKRQRPGRNPQTGEPIKISERRVMTFKASQVLKQVLNPKMNGQSARPSGTQPTAAAVAQGLASSATPSALTPSAPPASGPVVTAPMAGSASGASSGSSVAGSATGSSSSGNSSSGTFGTSKESTASAMMATGTGSTVSAHDPPTR